MDYVPPICTTGLFDVTQPLQDFQSSATFDSWALDVLNFLKHKFGDRMLDTEKRCYVNSWNG